MNEARSDLPVVFLELTQHYIFPGVAVIHYSLEFLHWLQRSMLPLTVHNTETKTLTIPLVTNETIHHQLFKRLKTKACPVTENIVKMGYNAKVWHLSLLLMYVFLEEITNKF